MLIAQEIWLSDQRLRGTNFSLCIANIVDYDRLVAPGGLITHMGYIVLYHQYLFECYFD